MNWDEFERITISCHSEKVNFSQNYEKVLFEYTRIFSIDAIKAKTPGNGAFARLLEHLKPFPVLVRGTHLRFAKHLETLGFKQVNRHLSQIDMLLKDWAEVKIV